MNEVCKPVDAETQHFRERFEDVVKNNRNRNLIDGMRMLADFLEAHNVYTNSDVSLHVFAKDKDDLIAKTKGVGLLHKSGSGDWFHLDKKFGPRVVIRYCIERPMICERVKVGERVIPAQPEKVVPASPERVEEIFDWKCPESLMRCYKTKEEMVVEAALR